MLKMHSKAVSVISTRLTVSCRPLQTASKNKSLRCSVIKICDGCVLLRCCKNVYIYFLFFNQTCFYVFILPWLYVFFLSECEEPSKVEWYPTVNCCGVNCKNVIHIIALQLLCTGTTVTVSRFDRLLQILHLFSSYKSRTWCRSCCLFNVLKCLY